MLKSAGGKKMKATEFANYFDFTIQFVTIPDEELFHYAYDVVDNQGVFYTREIDDVTELVDCFDSMLPDYVESVLEEHGFEPKMDQNYWEQALEWIRNDEYLKDTDTREIIECLMNSDLIENDVE